MNKNIIKWAALGITTAFALYLIIALYIQEQYAFAGLFLVVIGSAIYIFSSEKTYSHRYIYPAMAGMTVFIVFPLVYTIGIGFTNYSASNLLTFERVKSQLLQRQYQTGDSRYSFNLYAEDQEYVLQVESAEGDILLSEPFTFAEQSSEPLQMESAALSAMPTSKPLTIRDIVKLKKQLRELQPVVGYTHLSLAGLRQFAAMAPVFTEQNDGGLLNNKEDTAYYPNEETGFFEDAEGNKLTPGWTVTIGWTNFLKVVTDETIRGPFIEIFAWTITFATLSVLFTLALGLLLANVLQWELIKGKGFYRMMLILPYAVPSFISILVFKGLFNQNFGEINMVLEGLFGISPDWFSEPFTARSMLLIVNTWLGYPYMMLLCVGMLQAIPRDLYEASAMDGATPMDNLLKITLPQIVRPMLPLVIASFAFNFNNFVLIALLTGGGPDIIGASTPAGTTDLLVSYTFRIAFQDSGQDFGLAAAIATVIFLLVGALSLINLKLTKVQV